MLPRRGTRAFQLLLGLIALAALVRLWRIGHQSYWLDESFTVRIARDDLAGMISGVRHTESTPPLYYALAWLWERVFGWHEAGLRSLSAVPRRGDRAGCLRRGASGLLGARRADRR